MLFAVHQFATKPQLSQEHTATQQNRCFSRLAALPEGLEQSLSQELRNTAVTPFLSPSSAGQSVNHNYPLYTENTPVGLRRGSHRDSTVFRTHSADTWPHGAVGWREPRSWLLSGVYHPIMCLCPCQTPLHTVPVLAAAQNSQGNF